MANTIRTEKTIVNRRELSKIKNTEFNTFVDTPESVNTDTVEELFRLYSILYYEIPLEGDNSHSFLIQESSKLVSLDPDTSQIQPLIDEITQLRERLLQANLQIIQLQTQSSINVGN